MFQTFLLRFGKSVALFCLTTSLISDQTKDLKDAERLFDSGLYTEAGTTYEKILEDLKFSKNPFSEEKEQIEMAYHLRNKQAQAFYFAENYPKVLLILKDQTNPDDITSPSLKESYQQGLYLKALAYKQLKEPEKVIQTLEESLLLKEKNPEQSQEIQWELALAYFQLNKLLNSASYLEALNLSLKPHDQLYFPVQLYLARIQIAEKQYDQAEKILSSLSPNPSSDPLLKYEIAFLRGKIQMQLEQYERAITFFEKALPARNHTKAAWYPDTLYLLGLSYLQIGIHSPKDTLSSITFLDKAESMFIKRLEYSKDEQTSLDLGRTYIVRGQLSKDTKILQKAETILSEPHFFTNKDLQAQALLLRAEATSAYSDRDKLYRQLTTEALRDSPLYAKGWYLRGLNDFEEAQALLTANRMREAYKAFDRAIFSLKKAAELLASTDKAMAGLAFKYQAQANFLQNTQESRLTGLKTIESLLSSPEIIAEMIDPDEIYYLHSYITLQLTEGNASYPAYQTLLQSLEQQIINYPQGDYADDALILLGTLAFKEKDYQKAKTFFLKLSSDYPQSNCAGDAFFWISKCSEALEESPESIKKSKQIVYENYPLSAYAPEAYFTYYSYADYIHGEPTSIKHLQQMPAKFSKSPFLLNAYFLIGMDNKRNRKSKDGKFIHKRNLKAAIDAFQEVESTFDLLYPNGSFPTVDPEYFITIRYRSTLERALANLAIAEESKGAKKQIYMEYATEVLRQIVKDFENPDHPLTQHLDKGEPYPRLLEESEYSLALTYAAAGNDRLSEQTLNNMIEKYRAAKITRGYFLSRAWYESGCIAMQHNNFDEALRLFTLAEDAGKGKILSSHQKLDLWIQQSLCLKSLNQMDKSMLILSKVINEDAISSLRLKAMYLRAEVYESQGRYELARKQLEATAKKGGEWALKAKEKLDKEYGF